MKNKLCCLFILLALLTGIYHAAAQGTTAFAYNGQLNVNGSPANGSYDLQFTLYNAGTNGTVFGMLTNTATGVTNGLFVVTLDFGGAFNGTSYWLQIAARTNGGGAFTTLLPRQQIMPTPYALYSANAGSAATATTASSANSVTAAGITGTISLAQLPGTVVTNNSGLPLAQVMTNFSIPSYAGQVIAVNPTLNEIYLSGGASSAQPVIVVNGATFSQTSAGNGMGADVDLTNNNYWSGGVYSDNVTVWNSSNTALASPSTGSGCTFETSVDAPHRVVWAGAQCSDSIWAFNADTYAVLDGPISPNGVMGPLLVNPATGRLYFVSSGGSQRVKPSTYAVSANAFGTVFGVNASADLIYAQSTPGGTTLQIINGAPDPEVVLTNVTLPYSWNANPQHCVNPVQNQIYIGYNSTNIVGVFNATTGQGMGNISLGASVTSLGAIAVDASRNLVYAIAFRGSSPYLYVIQTASSPALTVNGTIAATGFTGNGAGLTNLNAAQLTGTLLLAQLPAAVVTNNEAGVTLNGAFAGNLGGGTNLALSGLQSGGATSSQIMTWNGSGWAPSNAPAGGGGVAISGGSGTNENFYGTTTLNGPLTATNLGAAGGQGLAVTAGNGTGNGGSLIVNAGNAGTSNGGSGGNLTLNAGNAAVVGGIGYGGLGSAGNVSINAGSGYNSTGGNVDITSGGNSPWNLSLNSYSEVSLFGSAYSAGAGAELDVEGEHNTVSNGSNSGSGGNIRLTAGNASGSYTGGNILLLPGTGTPGGNVGIGTTSPTTALQVNGTVTATGFSGSGSGLTSLNASQLTSGTISLAQLPAAVVTNNTSSSPVALMVTNFAITSGAQYYYMAVNPALNEIYLSGGASSAQPVIVVNGATFRQTSAGNGMGADVDLTNNNYWSGGVYSDNVTVWSSNNTALANPSTGSGCAIDVSVDAPHRRVWVAAQCSDSMWEFNADTYALVEGPISDGGQGGLIVNPATGRVYCNITGTSHRVNPSTYAVTANSFGMVFGVNASANLLYATPDGITLQIVNGAPDPEVVLTNITLPYPLSYNSQNDVNPALNQIYIGYGSTNIVGVFNATTGQSLGNVVLGAGITNVRSIAVDASRNLVYALAYNGSSPYLYVYQFPALAFNGTIAATGFTGSGAGLTNVPASAITGGITTNAVVGGHTFYITNGIIMNFQ